MRLWRLGFGLNAKLCLRNPLVPSANKQITVERDYNELTGSSIFDRYNRDIVITVKINLGPKRPYYFVCYNREVVITSIVI